MSGWEFGRRPGRGRGALAGLMCMSAVAAGTASRAEERPAQLEEIVVTAQKSEENLQKTPVAVTALTAAEIQRRGISDPADLQGRLPGVQFQPIGDLLVTIRGVGTFNLQPGVDSAVSYNLDGTYLSHATALPATLFDLERVEALRGPQGTLFGRNANAGAISLITAKPALGKAAASGSIQAGDYGLFATEAMVNLPLGEDAAIRGAFATQRHDGYLSDGHNDAHNYAGRLRLLVKPSTAFSYLATVDYSKQRGEGASPSPCPPESVSAACGSVRPWRPFAGQDTPNPADFRTVKNLGVYGEGGLDLDWAKLTSITSWRRVEFANLNTTGPFGYFPTNTDRLFSQEVRLASPSASPVKWVLGAYYSRERLHDLTTEQFSGFTFAKYEVSRYLATSKAVFAQATVPLTDSFRLTGGLRYTDEQKTALGTAENVGSPPTPTGGLFKTSRVTWKAGAEWDVAPASMLYASASTGFKSGGVNQVPAGVAALPAQYAPETIKAYELGSKNRFLDGRLQVNAEAFYYDYSGYQTINTLVDPTGTYSGIFFVTLNSDSAKFWGGEVELAALLTDRDRVDLNAAVLHAKFGNGAWVNNAPRYTFSGGYSHTFPLPGGADLRAGVDTVLTGPQYVDAANSPGAHQKAYTQTSANLEYEAADRRWSVSGWVRNLENKGAIYSYFGAFVTPYDLGYPLAPRTWGMTLRVRTN